MRGEPASEVRGDRRAAGGRRSDEAYADAPASPRASTTMPELARDRLGVDHAHPAVGRGLQQAAQERAHQRLGRHVGERAAEHQREAAAAASGRAYCG